MGTRGRLVVETDAGRKEALQRVLKERGITIADWFEEQLDLLLVEDRPPYADIDDQTVRSGDPVRALEAIDWAFTDADTTYLSHDIHPYPAKFIPQIPATVIRHLSERGDIVLDPFGGSGTTALEALRLGRRAVSLDANPLAELIGRVKTGRIQGKARAELRSLRALITGHLDALPADDSAFLAEYEEFVPDIPNIEKWFPPSSRGELALIRAASSRLNGIARDIALLALSRIVVSASFQDSETRYASRPRHIPVGAVLRMYLAALDAVVRRVEGTSSAIRYGVARFATADARSLRNGVLPDCSVDLVVTSPPYGNATDYHLYHRFRLYWLGFDPKALGRIEIGSHLRHQREGTGFEAYLAELEPCVEGIYRVLRPGCYAVIVLGDSVYDGAKYDTATEISAIAGKIGFDSCGIIERPIHETRRSFVAAGRRATTEKLVVLRRPINNDSLLLLRPGYRLWQYEEELRRREISALVGGDGRAARGQDRLWAEAGRAAKRLAFSRGIEYPGGSVEPTWQQILENGYEDEQSRRKDPKYVSHGIHPYKGKFYPQLAKCLLNVIGIESGAKVLDPFCGSGTTLLEARLNGLRAFGCDLNPLAAKIARAKVGIIDIDPDLVLQAVGAIEENIRDLATQQPTGLEQFPEETHPEILSWFAEPIALQLNAVLRAIRNCSAGVLREYLEVVLSSIVREVSHQDPRDLRIRRRKTPLNNADVPKLFLQRLSEQVDRLEHFWATRGYSPFPFYDAKVVHGDSRKADAYRSLGIDAHSIDCVLTSPPYATALPYIDTDRLSLLLFFGLTSSSRRPLEMRLTGSREINLTERRHWEAILEEEKGISLPSNVVAFLKNLLATTRDNDVGFRRKNLPSLLLRFFADMAEVMTQCLRVLRTDGEMLFVVGDSTTEVDGKRVRIPTTDFVRDIACHLGMTCVEEINIEVTVENLKHIKHAITENRVLRLKRMI